MTICNLPSIGKPTLPSPAKPRNNRAGPESAEIWTFNRKNYKEDNFLPSSVRDRPQSEASDIDTLLMEQFFINCFQSVLHWQEEKLHFKHT